MDIKKYKEQAQECLLTPMLEFIDQLEDDDYSKKDVKKCERLVNRYLKALGRMKKPTDAAIMKQVKRLVLALNKLNERTDYALLETGEREELWDIIQKSAVECGLQNIPDDVTEEWRDW